MANPLVKKGIPSFNKVSDKKAPVKPVENKTDVDTNSSVDVSTNLNQFYTPPVKVKNKQVSIYLDEDVIEALNQFGKENGKGSKSELVNNFLKQVFNIRQGGQN